MAESAKGLDLVGLDDTNRIRFSRGSLSVDDAVSLIQTELCPDIVCIDAPSGWSAGGPSRQAERDLARLGAPAFATGPDPGEHRFYRWVRVGISLFDHLQPHYPRFRGVEPRGTCAEVFPNATAVVLAGRRRTAAETKRDFRRMVLRSQGVDEQALPNLDRVDAALAALTGCLALRGHWRAVGDPEEGVVLIPAGPS